MAKEILIGDSDKANQKEFQKILGTRDYHLVFSESGEDVLLRVKLFKPDLIIAGTALIEKNGYELCEAIKQDPNFRSIPFILFLNMFEEISDKDRQRLKADGILSKPLHPSQVLTMVDGLLEGMRSKEGGISGKKMILETFADMGEERFASSEAGGKEEEEIIDLLDVVEDVVEEPESKMSIDDFVAPEKAEPFGEMTSSESWGKLGEEEKVAPEEGFVLSLEGEEEKAKDFPFTLKEEAPTAKKPQEEDLFEKIELEDILEKIGKIELPPEIEEPARREFEGLKRAPAAVQGLEQKPSAFDEFELALKKGVEAKVPREEAPAEETLPTFSLEETKKEVAEESGPLKISVEEKVEIAEEEFPKDLLEDMLKEEALKEEVFKEEAFKEEVFKEEAFKEGAFKEEVFKEEVLKEEAFKEVAFKEVGLREEVLEEEELEAEGLQEEPLHEEGLEEALKEEKLFEEEELLEEALSEEELLEEEPLKEETLEGFGASKEEEIELFEGLVTPEIPAEEKRVIAETREMGAARAKKMGAPRVLEMGVTAPLRRKDQQVEEVISGKVQVMMEDFITKHVPEMTKDIVQLTIERIERMLREIVPDLAEKMIEEEIRRLEKGETD